MDAALVGMDSDAIVGDTYGHPHGAFLFGAFANHFKDPHLVGVGDGEGFTAAGIAVFLCQRGHDGNGFACGFRPLQGDGHEADVVDGACGVNEFFAASEGGFHDRHLVLVDVSDNGICCFGFGDVSEKMVGVAVDDAAHGAFGMAGGGVEAQRTIHAEGVLVVGDECGTVCRGFFAYEKTGACRRLDDAGGKQKEGNDGFLHVFILCP